MERGATTGVVLGMLPPYEASPWLGMGLVLVRGLLHEAGIASRIQRFLDDPTQSPEAVVEASLLTAWKEPALEERLARAREIVDTNPEWAQPLLHTLAAAPEPVVGLSVWRHNADVTLEVARRLRELSPDKTIVLGGPEATTNGADLAREWIDVVVGTRAESVAGEVMRAAIDRTLDRVADLDNVWVHARHRGAHRLGALRHVAMPALPRMRYEDVLSLFRGDWLPDVPFLLNLGCPFRCGFCTNTTVYPELQFRDVDRVLAEMDEGVCAWAHQHRGREVPPMTLTLCDAAANAWPDQFDRLCEGIAGARWPVETELSAMIIVDSRVTEARVQRYLRAGLRRPFFGLETASPKLRRRIKKPGSAADIRRALEAVRSAGGGEMKLSMNVIVGFPDETEDDYLDTIALVEHALELGVLCDLGVMPLVRTPDAMDAALLRDARGPRRGYDWRGDGPGGDPEVRARRYLGVFERFQGRVGVSSPVPRDQLIAAMMPDKPAIEVAEWLERYGRRTSYFQQAQPESTRRGVVRPEVRWAEEVSSRLESVLVQGRFEGWELCSVEPSGEAALALLRRGEELLVVELRSEESNEACLARAPGLRLGYRQSWDGNACAERPEVVRALAARLGGQ